MSLVNTPGKFFTFKPAAVKEAEQALQRLKGDVSRLADIVSKQQGVIIEYATREYRAENVFKAVVLDSTTSQWLESERGASCAMNSDHSGNKSRLFNTEENLTRVTELIKSQDSEGLMKWTFDLLKTPEDQLGDVACKLFDFLDLYDQIPSLDKDKVHGAVRACVAKYDSSNAYYNSFYCVELLRNVAICLVNVAPKGRNRPKLSCADVLGVMFAAALFGIEHSGYSDDFLTRSKSAVAEQFNEQNTNAAKSLHVFLTETLPGNDFLGALDLHLQLEFKQALLASVAAADVKQLWSVVNNLDVLTLVTLDQVIGPDNSCTNFTDKELLKESLIQGIFCACAHGAVFCKRLEQSKQWAKKCLDHYLAQGAKEEEQGLAVNSYYEMSRADGAGENNSLTLDLMALNVCDFTAAPVYVALGHHVPTLQEALGNLFVNRGEWASQLESNTAVPKRLKGTVKKRSKAFDVAFSDVKFQPLFGSEELAVRENFASRNFLSYHGQTFHATGSLAMFLSELSGTRELRKSHCQVSLAQSVGFIQQSAPMSPEEHKRTSREAGKGGKHAQVMPLDMVPYNKPEDLLKNGQEDPSGTGEGSGVMVNLPKQIIKNKHKSMRELTSDGLSGILLKGLHHPLTYPVLTYLTVFALFGDDIKLAVFSKSADAVFGWITLVTFFCFGLEMFAKAVTEPNYMNGFFFWLDLIATISLIPDIPLIWDAFLLGVESAFSSNDEAVDPTLTRATRASRAGARATRIVRIIRLVRLLRILKLYEFLKMRENNRQNQKKSGRETVANNGYAAQYLLKRRMSVGARTSSPSNAAAKKSDKWDNTQQSKVGAKLADLTTRRVIVFVLLILFVLPLINHDEIDYSLDARLGMLHTTSIAFKKGIVSESAFNTSLQSFISGSPNLILLQVQAVDDNEPIYGSFAAEDALRPQEFIYAKSACVYGAARASMYCHYTDSQDPTSNLTSYASIDNRDLEIEIAWRSIGQTLFIIAIFGIATMTFTYDAHKLVIAPIEKMVKIVEQLAENPLTTFDEEEEESKNDPNESEALRRARAKHKKSDDGGYETKLLENCIKKIGGLLQVGFGEAGAEIIASNMNGSGLLDPMVPGHKVQAVFGFCDIRNFMATTEVLRENVMLYVNEIANIVHTQVAKHSGACNRSMGDSFLLIWKRNPQVKDDWETLAEKALISFLKVTLDLQRNNALQQYTNRRAEVGAKLRTSIPNFKVKLGFGLHVGWAIEGAIGSSFKIDASYLSPHVNLASRLEEYTRRYGVTLLMSGEFHGLLGPNARRCCRMVDNVVLKGRLEPTMLYTYDCNLDKIKVKLEGIGLKTEDVVATETVDRRISLIGPAPMIDHNRELVILEECPFQTDLELAALQWELPPQFLPVCRKGVQVYLAGKWDEAKILFEAAIRLYPEESKGPSKNILSFMEKHNFQAPEAWDGIRHPSM